MRLASGLSTVARALSGPAALTWTAWLITLPLSVVVALTPENAQSTRTIWAGALAATIAHIVLIPAFLLSVWWLKSRRPLIVVLLIYAIIGALRGFTVVTIEQSIAPSTQTSLIGRVTVSSALAVVGFTTIAVVIDRIRNYRQERQRLQVALNRVQALGPIPGQLAAIEGALDELSNQPGISAEELAARIQHLVNEEVRPMSHRMLTGDVHAPQPALMESQIRRMRLNVPPPNPWIVALALEGGAFVSVTQRVGVVASLTNVVIAGLVVAGLGLIVNAVITRLQNGSRALSLGLITVAYAGVGVIVMLVSDLIFRLFGSVVPLYLVAIPFAALWAILVSLATGADNEARASEEALARLLRQEVISATASKVNAQALARRMHGSVQGDLTAIMMGLRHLTSPLTVADAQVRLRCIRDSLMGTLIPGSDENAMTIRDEIDSFIEVWSQALDVQWRIGPDCLDRLARDSQSWAGIRTIVMEGLTNVVRHASVARAVVAIDADGSQYRATITSPGNLNISTPGMGLKALSTSYGQVDLQQRNGQVILGVAVASTQPPTSRTG